MKDIEKLITDEKYNLEFKEQVNFKESKKYLKAVSSFANGYDIGYIIFGIEDETKKIVGVRNIKKSYEEVVNRIKTRIDPSIIPTIDITNIQGKDVIVVKVIPGHHTPYYYVNKGTRTAYIRKGDQDCEANSTELNEMILRGKNMGWDEQVSDCFYQNFTFKSLKKYFKNIKGFDIDKESLISFNLFKDDKLTNAALLLSDQNPVVGSFVACTRWDGLEKISAKDDIEYYGSILEQIDNSMEFIKKHMSNGWVKEGGNLARREIPEYDLDALREALINAEVHRQYLMRGTNIELGFYNDRIEIISCGGLESRRKLEDFLKKPTSTRRNQLICDIFSRLDFMERRGSGIAKMIQAYKEDEKKPKIEVLDDIFCVTFYSRLYSDKTSEKHPKNIRKNPKNLIYEYIKENKKASKKYIIEDLELTEGQVKHAIKSLKEQDKIESIGKGKKTYYIIKKNIN